MQGLVGMDRSFCRDGRGWIRISAGMGEDVTKIPSLCTPLICWPNPWAAEWAGSRSSRTHQTRSRVQWLSSRCFSKIQTGFTFLIPAHPGSPGQRVVKRVCVQKRIRCVSLLCAGWWNAWLQRDPPRWAEGCAGPGRRLGSHWKGKINLDFTEARDSEWQWQQLGHMQLCTSLQTDNHHSVFYRLEWMPFLPPNQQLQSTEGRLKFLFHLYFWRFYRRCLLMATVKGVCLYVFVRKLMSAWRKLTTFYHITCK